MPNEMNPNDPLSLWQSQEVEKVTLTLDEVRQRAARFEQRIQRRNLGEYLAGAFVVAVGAAQVWHASGWRKAPPALAIAATLYVMVQLRRRGSARRLAADMGIRGSIEFHRVELERQRDAVHSVWRWYLLPFVPSLVGALIVSGIDHGINTQWIKMAAVFVLVFVGVSALNRTGARKFNQKIQKLKVMETDYE